MIKYNYFCFLFIKVFSVARSKGGWKDIFPFVLDAKGGGGVLNTISEHRNTIPEEACSPVRSTLLYAAPACNTNLNSCWCQSGHNEQSLIPEICSFPIIISHPSHRRRVPLGLRYWTFTYRTSGENS